MGPGPALGLFTITMGLLHSAARASSCEAPEPESGASVQPAVLAAGEDDLRAQLGDPDPARRRRAVRDLAGLGSSEAWASVVDALSDPSGEVADEAQWQLARLQDEGRWRDLFRRGGLRHEQRLVRLRVAEALGRREPADGATVDGRAILGALDRRDPELGEVLLWSIERLAWAGHLGGDLDRLSRELSRLLDRRGDSRLRAQALVGLAALDRDAVLAQARSLSADRDHRVRVALLEVLSSCPPSGGDERGESNSHRDLVRAACADEHAGVRLAACEAMAAGADRAALELLVDRLEVEPRLRVRTRCMELLQQLSGRRSKLDPRPWRRWLEGLPEDWRVARPSGPTSPADPGGTASFAGLPVLSDRVCFLIDFSGSLWYEREGRPPRKARVDVLLREALPRLDHEARFNVIPYTGRPHPWSPRLVPARPREVAAALSDFEACRERGSGNVFDAIRLALEDEGVDRLVILTDGVPTGGDRWKLELLVPLVAQAVRFDRVAVDSVVVDARSGIQQHWQRMAEATGGRSLGVDL